MVPFLGLVLSLLLYVLGSHVWAQAVQYDLYTGVFFLHCLSRLILSLTLLELGSKSISLIPGFYVCRSRLYTMQFVWSVIFFFKIFYFSLLIVWTDIIKGCGWCLGGRGCWLRGLYQISSVTCMFHHLPHLCQGYHDHYVVTRNDEEW